jgi:hypothetical protein
LHEEIMLSATLFLLVHWDKLSMSGVVWVRLRNFEFWETRGLMPMDAAVSDKADWIFQKWRFLHDP